MKFMTLEKCPNSEPNITKNSTQCLLGLVTATMLYFRCSAQTGTCLNAFSSSWQPPHTRPSAGRHPDGLASCSAARKALETRTGSSADVVNSVSSALVAQLCPLSWASSIARHLLLCFWCLGNLQIARQPPFPKRASRFCLLQGPDAMPRRTSSDVWS